MLDPSRGSTATRISIVLAVSAGMALVSAGGASAAGGLPPAPAPIAAAAAPVTAPPAAPTGTTVLPVNLFITVPNIGSIPLPAPPPPFAATPAPAPLTAGLIQLSTGVKGALNQIGAGLAPIPLAPLAPSGAAGALANIVAQAAPLATVCVQVTGSGTALLNTDLKLLGVDLSSPLIQTFPGFLAPCPVGSVPAPGTGSTTSGSTIVGVNSNLGSLVGACVRVTTSVVPLQVTLLVLNQDVISKLTAAGLPLRQLIVPCPTGTPTPGTGGPGGGGSGTGGPGGGGSGTGGPGGGGSGTGGPASGIPTTGSLAFTGAEIGLLLALAAAVIGAGTIMVRKARANQWAVNI